jgi:hypothetical protein
MEPEGSLPQYKCPPPVLILSLPDYTIHDPEYRHENITHFKVFSMNSPKNQEIIRKSQSLQERLKCFFYLKMGKELYSGRRKLDIF